MTDFPIEPTQDWIATHISDKGAQITAGGIIQLDDNMKSAGIRPRWAKVLAVGPEVREQDNIEIGDYILLEHLGWVRGMEIDIAGKSTTVHWTNPSKILLVGDGLTEDTLPQISKAS